MIDRKAADAFWHVVKACLIQFHKFSESEADQKIVALRKRIESPPTGMSSDMFYHAEPFDVACDIAEEQLKFEKCRQDYDIILNKYQW